MPHHNPRANHAEMHEQMLERKRQMMLARLELQRERINARFEEKQAQINGKMNLKQQQIIEAGLELLTKGGLAAISLRDLAKSINIQAPALYWYFKNKEDLVDYMAEAILQKEFHDLKPRADNETWQDWFTNHMKKLRKAMLAYPDGARVVAGAHIYPAVTLARSLDTSLESLVTAGVDIKTARFIVGTATHYTFGRVIEEQSSPSAEELKHFDMNELLAPYPYMRESFKEYDFNKFHAEEDFATGLEYIIRGSGAQ
jgi:TetR/AcrR family tetracycline transcriptional repressor